jgi:IS30 family transposase
MLGGKNMFLLLIDD